MSAPLHSSFSNRTFELAHCASCHYSFIVDPPTDFARLYDAAYYEGKGADPNVDYERELDDPRTVREYEWRAILTIVEDLRGSLDGVRWLDFGCGLGGLVRYARARGIDVTGFDEGYAARRMQELAIPALDPSGLAASAGAFDVVTAIEVLEHLVDPMPALRQIATLLRPGGLLFVTTGNAAPFRGRFEQWSYVHPDVHVGYFEPVTLETALRGAGLDPSHPGFVRGYADLIRYKVLKSLGFKRRGVVERLVPWSLASRVVDRRHRVSAQPVGWRR
ncbi:MAG TPA: class I SAM-dependent methyltransferase [Acidimicrobiia bacterium]|nr:class I SAM-dependent methyltransferase [Acidimicrobiia bacterium]